MQTWQLFHFIGYLQVLPDVEKTWADIIELLKFNY